MHKGAMSIVLTLLSLPILAPNALALEQYPAEGGW